jgi:hypothetical protein
MNKQNVMAVKKQHHALGQDGRGVEVFSVRFHE